MPTTPDDRAAALVTAAPKTHGGPWFVSLNGPDSPPVLLGPYENPENAKDDATKVRAFVASVIREADRAEVTP